VEEIARAIQSVEGIVVLDREMDRDHNRSVITFAGPPETAGEAAVRGVARAVELIDLNRHTGEHPRIGAADVVPFVPLEGVEMQECVELAHRTGEEIWRRCGVPVYFYEAAARDLERVNLEKIRRGQFEGLREEVRTNPARRPDVGGPDLHPTAGATVVGARKFLIAYNINLATSDLDLAKSIARAIREKDGGFPCVKAMGVMLEDRHLAQVSINMTDFRRTPLHRVFETIRSEAARYGVEIVGSEIVGLVPQDALLAAAEHYLRIEEFSPDLVLENRLEED
ncbi:MAG: glutamate formimidoyltransferase, partial [Acidobacteria bacterium]